MSKINGTITRIVSMVMVVALGVLLVPNSVFAAQITGRKVVIGTSAASASTTYTFSFTVPSATVVQSASFTACTTASGTCTTPAGFSVASSTLASQPTNLGDASGWTVSTATAGSLRLSKSGDVAAPTGNQTVSFANVVNQSAANASFFIRMTTYSDAAWTTPIDTGTVVSSTAGQITVTANVDEALTFTLASATAPLGTLTSGATGSNTSSMTAATNASSGYSITASGSTLTSGSNTIPALSSPTASTTGTKQFGINLMSNTTPAVGAVVSGAGSGIPATGYNTANQFKFNSGDTVASASVPTNSNTYTVSYIANIDNVTAPGAYSSVITYVATPNF